MAGRNGTVETEAIFVRVPVELKWLVKRYQTDNRIKSFADTLVRLLESHPEIAKTASRVYAEYVNDQAERETLP